MAKTFTKLTRPAMRRLVRGGVITEHGISFKRLESGDGVFAVNIMVDGRRIHRVIGKESERVTRTQAEDFIAQARTEARQDRLKLPKGRKTEFSFREASEKYLSRLEKSDGRDIDGKRRKLNQHLVPFFGKLPLSKVSAFQISRYVKARTGGRAIKSRTSKGIMTYKEAPPTSATINRELAVISHLFTKAIEWGWVHNRPKIPRLKEENGRIVYLTARQASRLVECAKSDNNAQIYPFIVVGLSTGMRVSEILAIKKSNVFTDRKVIYIPKAKAGAREQPITSQLAEFLEGYIEGLQPGCDWLFPSPASRTGHTVNINKPFKRVVIAAGLDPNKVVRHTLRHTAITHLVQAGVDLPTVKRISGHKTLIMVERYAHTNGDHINQAMEKLEKRELVAGI